MYLFHSLNNRLQYISNGEARYLRFSSYNVLVESRNPPFELNEISLSKDIGSLDITPDGKIRTLRIKNN